MALVFGGLDVSKTATGWGIVGSEIQEAGAFKCPVKKPFELARGQINAQYAGDVGHWFSKEVASWLSSYRPDVVAIEQPMPGNSQRTKTEIDTSSEWAGQSVKKVKVGGTSFDTTHFLHGLAFEAARLCRARNIEVVYVASQTWRGKEGLGIGVAPKAEKDRSGWYKKQAKIYAKSFGMELTSGDAAEGFCIAVYLRNQRERPHGLFPGLT